MTLSQLEDLLAKVENAWRMDKAPRIDVLNEAVEEILKALIAKEKINAE